MENVNHSLALCLSTPDEALGRSTREKYLRKVRLLNHREIYAAGEEVILGMWKYFGETGVDSDEHPS